MLSLGHRTPYTGPRITLRVVALVIGALLIGALAADPSRAQLFEPGAATAAARDGRYELSNRLISAAWSAEDGKLQDFVVTDKLHHKALAVRSPFALLFQEGTIADATHLRLVAEPRVRELSPVPSASRYADRLPGRQIDADFAGAGGITLTWSLVLRDDSNYLRQIIRITAGSSALAITRVRLIDLSLDDAHVVGAVKGSPIVAGYLFLGLESPLADSKFIGRRALADLVRDLPLTAGQTVSYSSVIGVTRAGQMRRDFLRYLERERAHPYRTFLHYNSWYDLGYFTPFDEAGALDRIQSVGRELHEKRGVTLDSFLFDDGWDDHATLWRFNSGFPMGFTKLHAAAEADGAAPGVWLSPWGGYGKPKQERIEAGKAAGFEIVAGGFALSGPTYYARFRDVCLEMIQQYGVNQFKFDGTGNADSVVPGSRFDSDFAAAIHLIGELRAVKPDIYINLTTGTYPSPFWLMDADSIWRGGEDDSVAGVGPYRERWITYRDADTYDEIVTTGPLFPLNSLMLHGLIYAQHHQELKEDPGKDFRNEIRSYFGTGTQLQELYITPSLLSQANWDDLAEAALWSRSNADVLVDTHWVGGDPAWLEVYGWASWTPRKGIIVLRNPSDRAQRISLDLAKVFELPATAATQYAAKSPWKSDAGTAPIVLRAGTTHTFELAPFEVLTLDALPLRR
jgi:hypothetical protein